MAESFISSAPDFDQIRKEAGNATEDGIRLVWLLVEAEIASRRSNVRRIRQRLEGAIVDLAPTAAVNNYDLEDVSQIHFTGSTAQNFSGIANGEEGRILLLTTTGSGTITVQHNSTNSAAGNRILMGSGLDATLATDTSMMVMYIDSAWREMNWL